MLCYPHPPTLAGGLIEPHPAGPQSPRDLRSSSSHLGGGFQTKLGTFAPQHLPFPYISQILIRTASFLQKFTVSENSICMLSANDAHQQLHNIFIQFGDNIQTARQLRNTVIAKFFDKS